MSENKKISELDLVSSNASGDMFAVVQSGVTKRTTISKIVTYLEDVFATISSVTSQISEALTNYATISDLTSGLETKQNKQEITEVAIDADTISTLNLNNCILAISNLPNNGNKDVKIRLGDGLFEPNDVLDMDLIYKGFDINMRSYAIYEEAGTMYLSIYLNVHSNPTEPVLISINKSN